MLLHMAIKPSHKKRQALRIAFIISAILATLLGGKSIGLRNVQHFPKSGPLLLSLEVDKASNPPVFIVTMKNPGQQDVWFRAEQCGSSYRIRVQGKLYQFPEGDLDQSMLACTADIRWSTIAAGETSKELRVPIPTRIRKALITSDYTFTAMFYQSVFYRDSGPLKHVVEVRLR